MVYFKFLEHDNTLNKVSQFLPKLVYKYIEDIYYFGVNTKYISSRAVTKNSILRVCSTSENTDITPNKMKYIWFSPKKSKCSFYVILKENTESTT